MNSLLNMVLSCALICSFLGYMFLAQKALGLRKEFVPVFVFSLVTCTMYFFGLLGILFEGSILLMLLGVLAFTILLPLKLIKGSYSILSLSLFSIFWTIGSVFFLYILVRSKLIHYDNFSHWAIVVKQMLSTHSIPTAQSNLIDFKNYPIGISSFIYYVCRFAGNRQSVMIISQGMLIFSCFYAMFGIISEKKRFLLYAFLGLGCSVLSLFNITIRINNLLVDFLLPLFTLAIFSVAYQYRADHRRAFICALPIVGLLTITKSTGIVFAGIALIFLFYITFTYAKNTSKRKILALAIITILLASIPYLTWMWHVQTAFSGIENKFDLQNIGIEKTEEQIENITSLFISSSLNLTTRPAMGIVIFNLMSIIAIILSGIFLKKKWKLWRVLIALDIVVLLYYVGIWALYVFSMPLDEAIRLAGFDRYSSSIVVLFVGGLMLATTVDIENSFYYKIGQVADECAFKNIRNKKYYQRSILACMAMSIILLMSEYNGMSSIIADYDNTLPNKVQTITGDRWYENGEEDESRYLLYASDKEDRVTSLYMQYVGRYFLYAPNVDGIDLFYEDNIENLLSTYDYLVVVESDDNVRYMLNKHYGVSGKEGIYKIESKEDEKLLLIE